MRWLLLGLLLIPSVGMAQQATGTIGGTVLDSSGGVMPGVSVTLSSPGIVGGKQSTVTDERGTYQFLRLVPARYTIGTELQGFRSAVREDILVNADVTVRVDFTIEVGGVEEAITVRGGVPLLDTTATLNQTVIGREIVDNIPAGKNLWAFGALVPGVLNQKIDVGGSESFQASTQKIHGSADAESRYLVDGMNIGNSSTGGIMGYPDPLMYEEINFQTGQSPAENQQGGVVMNMITRSGSNVIRGSFEAAGSRQAWMSENLSASQIAELRSSIPARLLAINPGLQPSNAIPYIYDTGGYLSGPLLRNRLWWVATIRKQANDQIQLGSYNPDATLVHDDNEIRNYSGKLTWQATSKHQVSAFYNRTHKFRYHRTGDFSGASFLDNNATTFQDQPIDDTIVKWTAPLSSKILIDVGASSVSGPFARNPQPDVQRGDIARLDLVTQVGSVAAPIYQTDYQITRMFKSSVSYATSGHNFKAGYVLDWWSFDTSGYSMSHYPSGVTARYRNGVPDSALLLNTPYSAVTVSSTSGLFVQDTWTPVRRLTLNLGLRVQKTVGHNDAACQPATIFIAGMCYDRVDDLPNWVNWAPRFGLVYDVFGQGRTAVKMTANRYVFGAVTEFGTRVNPVRSANATVPWTDGNGDGVLQLSELNMAASTGFNIGNNNRYAPGLDSPYSNELSWEIEQQLFKDMVLSAGYYRRTIKNNVAARNVAVPTSGYVPLTVTEVSSGRQVTVYNQDPRTRGLFDIVWSNDPAMDQNFQGVDITLNKRMSDRWMLMGGYSYGRNTGDTFAVGSDLNNPNFTFRRGRVSTDTPHAVKMSGSYEVPLGVLVSGTYQYYTGVPRTTSVTVTAATVALTQVTQSLQVEPVGVSRLPSNSIASLRVSKNIVFGRSRITPAIDVFNLTNSNTPQNLINQLGPTYGRVAATSVAGGGAGVLRPRMVRLGVSMTF